MERGATVDDLALVMIPDLGAKTAAHLVGYFGSAEAVFAASESELVHGAELREELARRVLGKVSHRSAERELHQADKQKIRLVAATSDAYPELLLECVDRPHVLYVDGSVEVLRRPMISFCGTRDSTPYGKRMCYKLVEELAGMYPQAVIATGLGYGIEAACHHAAIACGLQSVAVLPCAIQSLPVPQHAGLAGDIIKHGGALVTEFGFNSTYNPAVYHQANRIIAGLSPGTVVVEAGLKSGSLNAADLAYRYDRALMAVPGRVTDRESAGTNRLIFERKAALVTSGWEILRELGLDAVEKPAKDPLEGLGEDERGLLESCYKEGERRSMEELAVLTRLPLQRLNTVLLNLEFSGHLVKRGVYYERP